MDKDSQTAGRPLLKDLAGASGSAAQQLYDPVDEVLGDVEVERHRAALLVDRDSVPDLEQLRLVFGHVQTAQADEAADGIAQADGVLFGAGGSVHLGAQAGAEIRVEQVVLEALEDLR